MKIKKMLLHVVRSHLLQGTQIRPGDKQKHVGRSITIKNVKI